MEMERTGRNVRIQRLRKKNGKNEILQAEHVCVYSVMSRNG